MTSGAVLLLTAASLFAYEFATFRQTSRQEVDTLGKAIAANSTAALAFANRDDAEDVLRAFDADPHIVAAALYDRAGKRSPSIHATAPRATCPRSSRLPAPLSVRRRVPPRLPTGDGRRTTHGDAVREIRPARDRCARAVLSHHSGADRRRLGVARVLHLEAAADSASLARSSSSRRSRRRFPRNETIPCARSRRTSTSSISSRAPSITCCRRFSRTKLGCERSWVT